VPAAASPARFKPAALGEGFMTSANLLIVILVVLVELDSRFCAPTAFKKLGADPLPE
jgi:hypothetical protein